MTTKAKPITLLIDSVDYSAYLLKAEVGYDSYSQGTGLILKKGSITIASISGGRALDPRDNNDFQVGNIVNIYYNVSLASPTAPHPIATVTRILAPPSVSPIESDLPVLEGNLLLEIPIGCELAYFKTKQADAEATGVTYGNPVNAQSVISNLLLKAGVPFANIGTSAIAISRFSIDFPYNKNGGSFIDLAGEFAYSTPSGFFYPSVLYCDRNNIIRQKLIKVGTNITYPLTITLGLNDREYLPQIDQSIAPGIVNISGIKRDVVDSTSEYPFTSSDITVEEGVTTIAETTYYKKNDPRFFYNNTLYSDKPIEKYTPSLTYSTGVSPKTNGIWQILLDYRGLLPSYPENVYSGSVTITKTGFYTTSQEIIFTFFEDEKLSHTVSINWAPTGSFYDDLSPGHDRFLMCTQFIYVGYLYNADKTVKLKETLTFKAAIAVNKSTNILYNQPIVFLTNVKWESWATKGKDVVYSESNYNAAGLDNPRITDDEEFFKLVPGRKTTITNKETSIPATEYAEDRYSETESIIDSSVTFGTGTNVKQYDIQIPFAWTETQLNAIGLVEGTIINGRQYQYLIECDPDLLETYQEPLFGVKVVEPTKHRYFLCDALSWVHTDTEDYVGMAGIYMGTSDAAASIPSTVSQSMIGVQESSGSIVFGGHSIQFICTGVCY